MTKQNQRTGVLVAVLIVCAISARVLGKFDVFPVPLGLVRTILYISLYIGWGLSVSHRILQTQVRRYMVGVSCLTVFWFVIRSIKYFLWSLLMRSGIYGTGTIVLCCSYLCFPCLFPCRWVSRKATICRNGQDCSIFPPCSFCCWY